MKLVLLPCDPLADMTCATEPAGLVYRGEWLDRAALDSLRQASAEQNVERTMANVFGGLAEYGVDVCALTGEQDFGRLRQIVDVRSMKGGLPAAGAI